MKSSIRSFAVLAVAGLLLLTGGCNTVSVSSRQDLGVPTFAPTDPATVQILRTPPMLPHIRLGEITCEPSGNPTVQAIEAKFQQAAAKMGANAVVIVADQTQIMGAYVTGPWWGRSIQTYSGRVIVGVAIRYTQ